MGHGRCIHRLRKVISDLWGKIILLFFIQGRILGQAALVFICYLSGLVLEGDPPVVGRRYQVNGGLGRGSIDEVQPNASLAGAIRFATVLAYGCALITFEMA